MAHLLNAVKLSITLLAILAWLNATNHCALATIGEACVPQKCHSAAATSDSHSDGHCPEGHKPFQKNDSKDSVGCCKNFAKAAQNTDSSPQFKNAVIKLMMFSSGAQLLPVAPKADLNPHYLDSGPPASFAETVLQRSLLVHAPPAVA